MWDKQDAAELLELPSDSVATLEEPFSTVTLLENIR
jgi:hypothetical protein